METASSEGDLKKKVKLYKVLLAKYSPLINEHNRKTVGEIKALVNGDDLTIQSVVQDIIPENYSFDAAYLETARKAFEFVRDEIDHSQSEIDLNYWFTPQEILTHKIADDEDSAVFLCSILDALGDENAFVVIAELSDLSTHAFAITEFKGKFYIFDPWLGHSFTNYSGNRDEVIQAYTVKGLKIKRFLYKFNQNEYKQFV